MIHSNGHDTNNKSSSGGSSGELFHSTDLLGSNTLNDIAINVPPNNFNNKNPSINAPATLTSSSHNDNNTSSSSFNTSHSTIINNAAAQLGIPTTQFNTMS